METNLRKKQPGIDQFFRRTRQKADGSEEIVQSVSKPPTVQKQELPCCFCAQTFGNAGALETHRLIKHSGRREVGKNLFAYQVLVQVKDIF